MEIEDHTMKNQVKENQTTRDGSSGPLKTPELESCHICNQSAVNGVNGRQVNTCDRCDLPVCESHADADYDFVGDPGYYRQTQWVCSDRNKCINDVDRAYIAERQVREIRTLPNPTHADYERIIFPERVQGVK